MNDKNNNGKGIVRLIINILLFFSLFPIYGILIGFICMFPLYLILGAESNGWVYGLILGIALSPILTIITLIKLNDKITL